MKAFLAIRARQLRQVDTIAREQLGVGEVCWPLASRARMAGLTEGRITEKAGLDSGISMRIRIGSRLAE